jgi:ABC-type oligopeptide transport system substrate-binding subunit
MVRTYRRILSGEGTHGDLATAADMNKTLRVMFPVAETGFDPQPTQDYYSALILRAMFDSLYAPDYLTRPYRMAPNTAVAMPEISADVTTWTIRVKPGLYFADDPVFGGKKRELTAYDYVYSWKRLVDPKVRSPNAFYITGKLVGLDAAAEKAKATGKFDYDADIEGLRAIDRYTLQLKLVEPDYTLMGFLQQSALAAVTREVIEAYPTPRPVTTRLAPGHACSRSGAAVRKRARGKSGVSRGLFPAAPANADAATARSPRR